MSDLPVDRAVVTAGEAAALHDGALLARMLRHDEGALADLYDRHARVLFALALRIVGDRALAEEVLQDAFLQCWRHAVHYDPARGSVAAWLIGVTRNRAIDLLRSRQHRARVRENHFFTEPGDGRDADAGGREDIALLRQVVGTALDRLPYVQREAIELAYYGGLTQREIAARQGQPLGTVKTRMRSGLERLHEMLRPLVDAPGAIRESP